MNMDTSTQVIDEPGNSFPYESPIQIEQNNQEHDETEILGELSSVNNTTFVKPDSGETTVNTRETISSETQLIIPGKSTMVIPETIRETKESHPPHIRNSQQMKTVRLNISLKDGYEFSFKEAIEKQHRTMGKSDPVSPSVQMLNGEELVRPSDNSDEEDPFLDKLVDGKSLDVSVLFFFSPSMKMSCSIVMFILTCH